MLDPLRLSYGTTLPRALQDVIQKLQGLYGSRLVVTALDARGATIRVLGFTEEVLIRDMMVKKAEIFGAEVPPGGGCVLGPGDFQILASLESAGAPGLYLRYLPNLPDGRDYLSGFWYY